MKTWKTFDVFPDRKKAVQEAREIRQRLGNPARVKKIYAPTRKKGVSGAYRVEFRQEKCA